MKKLDKLGWLIAAALTGAFVTSGFQGTNMKFANCDVETAFNKSDLTKTNQEQLQDYGSKRFRVLQFLGSSLFMQPDDTKNFADLSLLAKPTDAETQKLTTITKAAAAESQKQADLVQKPNPTAEDQKTLSDYHSRANQNKTFTQRLEAAYDKDIRDQQDKLKNDALEKVRKTIAEIARKQGYSIVFNLDSAPFAANNLTDEVVKEVNKS